MLHVRFPLVILIVTITFCSVMISPAWSQSTPPDIQVAAAVATILYFPFKATFALGDGIVGGLAHVISGFNGPTANVFGSPASMAPTLLRRSTWVVIMRYVLGALQTKVRECQPLRLRYISAWSEEMRRMASYREEHNYTRLVRA